jgi:hypothetical protein
MVSGTLYRALRKRGVGGGLAWGHREEGGWGVVSQFCAVGRLWVMLSEAAAHALCGGGLLNRGGRQGVHDVGRWGCVRLTRGPGQRGPSLLRLGCGREGDDVVHGR